MKNGKVFGKINIVDFLVIIAVLAALIGIFIRVTTFSENKVGDKVKFEYVLRVDNIRDYSVHGLDMKGNIYSEKDDKLLGEIKDVKYENYKADLVMLDGERKFVENPSRYTAYVTIQADGVMVNGKYCDASETELAVGTNYRLCSKYISTSGQIVKINTIE